jgi:GTP-binding protein
MGGDKNGKNGKDEVILVPCGCVVKNFETGEVIAELLKDGEERIILKGGRGGKGNTHFKSSLNRTPRFAQTGESGQELTVVLELKLIADIGLVGFPNAGKSTLISKISSAKPKIADYPFTTLKPNLGIIKYHDYDSFVMADIPGIIEGASSGKGLGIQFLRHIERTRILLFLIDSTQLNPDGTKLLKDYKVLLKEVENYEANLLDKPRIICFTKTDAISEELKKKLKSVKTSGIEKISISSVTGDNLDKLKDLLWTKLKRLNKDEETLNTNI